MATEHNQQFENRSFIKILVVENENATNVHRTLQRVFGQECISYSQVARWVSQFKRGRNSIDEEDPPGRRNSRKDRGNQTNR